MSQFTVLECTKRHVWPKVLRMLIVHAWSQNNISPEAIEDSSCSQLWESGYYYIHCSPMAMQLLKLLESMLLYMQLSNYKSDPA